MSSVVGRTASLDSKHGHPRTLRGAGASKPMWEGLAELVDSVASSGSEPAALHARSLLRVIIIIIIIIIGIV